MKLILLCFLSALSVFANAQLNSPESVEFDAPRNRYIVASTGGGGNLYSIIPGSAPVLFTSAVNNPYGICIAGDSLYVCDQSSYIKVFNLSTGAAAGSINTGGTFLNGICTDFAGNIYATDFSAKTIYRMNITTQQVNTFVANTSNTPNGIVFDPFHNRLVVACWGANAPIRAVSLTDSTISTVKPTSFSNIDGITIDQDGNFYIAEWGGDKSYFFDSAFANTPLLVVAGLSNPADISYNQLRDTLAIPNTSTNTITYHGFPRPAAVNDVDTVCIDSTKSICVLTNDFAPNNTPLVLSNHTLSINGTLNMQANCLQYQALQSGNETITYTVCTDDTPSFCKTGTLEIFNKTCAAQQLLPVADFTATDFMQPCSSQFFTYYDSILLQNTSTNADSLIWSVSIAGNSGTGTGCHDSIFHSSANAWSLTPENLWPNCVWYEKLSVCLTAYNSIGQNTKCDTTCIIMWEVGVKETQLTDVRLYPNPAVDILTVDMQNINEEVEGNYFSIAITNSLGQKVISHLNNGNNKVLQINIRDLPEGIYSVICGSKQRTNLLGRFTVKH